MLKEQERLNLRETIRFLSPGMDPVSRRFVWRHIDEIKDGRVILLTTHAMEEVSFESALPSFYRYGAKVWSKN